MSLPRKGLIVAYSDGMTVTAIHCPSCGHHIFDADIGSITSGKDSPGVPVLTPGAADAAKVLQRFFDSQQRVVRTDHGRAESVAVLAVIREWLDAEGLEHMTAQALGRGLRALGVKAVKSNGKRYYLGVAFTHAPR